MSRQSIARNIVWAIRIALVRLRFVGLMVGAALLVAYWDDVRARVDRALRPAATPDLVGEAAHEWFCPMDPVVVRDEPGKCPICGMGLSKRKKLPPAPLPPGVLARVDLAPYRVRLAGIATAPVERRPLAKRIEAVGTIDEDERRVRRIGARLAGRVEKLHVDFTGVKVAAGDPIYELYSPDLYNTQRELVLELEAVDRARAAGQAAPGPSPALLAARERLGLWGITKEQIEELERTRAPRQTLTIHSPIAGTVVEKEIHEGQYLQVGESPFTVADLSVVWMVARVYEDESALVRVGAPVEIAAMALPGRTFDGHVSFVDPMIDRDTRTVGVRVDVPNGAGLLKPGMYVRATLRAPIGARGMPGAAESEVVYRCCTACPEIESKAPGDCPKCGMPLTPFERADHGPEARATATAAATGEFVCRCPMHPGTVIRAPTPGACSLCGAPLVREGPGPTPAPRSTTPTATVYWCPMHPEVMRDAPGICEKCGGMQLIEKNLDAPAGPAHAHGTDPLAIPASAVIDTGTRKVVYREAAPGTYEAVEVTLGPRVEEHYPVVSGLAEGDRVVFRGAFLVDAEVRLNPAAAAAYFGASGQKGGRK